MEDSKSIVFNNTRFTILLLKIRRAYNSGSRIHCILERDQRRKKEGEEIKESMFQKLVPRVFTARWSWAVIWGIYLLIAVLRSIAPLKV